MILPLRVLENSAGKRISSRPGNDVDLLRQSDPQPIHRTKEIFNAALSETEAQIASRSTPVSYLLGNGHQSC
jgi:hypothetical protein